MPRKAKVVEVPAIGQLDRQAGRLSHQLARALRNAIHKGELKAGDLLPSTRRLSSALSLARGTVLEAFAQLTAEGFLEPQPGSGTRVARSLEPRRVRQSPARPHATDPIPLPQQARRLADFAAQVRPLPPVPFAVSVPTGDTAPDDIWRRLGNRIRARGPGAPSGYGDPMGALPLREAICEYVRRSRSVSCTPQQVMITSGTQQGLYLAAQLLLDAGEAAWVEDPAYSGITAIFDSVFNDRRMIRVPVADDGIDVAAGQALANRARAVFVTPSHQYPLGMPMSMAKRTALLAWAKEQQAWIVEDDYDSEMRYAGHPFPSLQGLDPGRVIYLGTFSKVLFPSLRLGYAIVPEPLIDAFCGARMLMDRHPPSADQHVLASFIAEGYLDRHIRKMRGVYAEKRRVLIEAINAHVDPALAWLQPCDQGMHTVLWLQAGLDDLQVARSANQAGLSLRAVSPMYAADTGKPGLVLGLGGYTDLAVNRAVQKLGQVIQACAAGPAP
ncbi:MocR-like pyridoxine biosynthesis transcription factor PdxR [Serratia entomophila]|uniref:MocR-like pyridoxine biosynthesis transcription factor PdxR n=1 Tax=Serratia entomophila TaxID=42906 RepID=UPI002178044C|nr:PLP-dependent aminotransferase family protein [Serratia entomophila]CAI1121733.1 HTH-type transcriptional regulatory protein gabR [Serratia entomophila]CAI1980423.1 HTH-type transcriptional regulatory protein gabR [Serratia entomophila]CAI2515330.1 HTH-type transcriptional regulatory protein gabR [Serratia entomophila]